jgi:hypothetical protein
LALCRGSYFSHRLLKPNGETGWDYYIKILFFYTEPAM